MSGRISLSHEPLRRSLSLERLVLMLVTRMEGEERECVPQGQTMFVHGMGGFPVWGCIGESTSDVSSGSGELIGGFGQTACKVKKEQTQWPRAEEEGEQNRNFSPQAPILIVVTKKMKNSRASGRLWYWPPWQQGLKPAGPKSNCGQ